MMMPLQTTCRNHNSASEPVLHGWLNLYKPYGLSSARAVALVKRLFKKQKVGHAGTLDPLAEGVLPIAVGEATKTSDMLVGAKKTYRFTVHWGEARSTDDAEGEVTATSAHRPSEAEIQTILPEFIGDIIQTPPAYSAIKVGGKRAYALTRLGKKVEIEPREIRIYSLSLMEIPSRDEAIFLCECGKGTYIRALARDVAERLGTYGYISRLIRESVGDFRLLDTISLDSLEELVHSPPAEREMALSERLLPLSTVLDDIPAMTVNKAGAKRLKHGQMLRCTGYESTQRVAVFHNDLLIALCEPAEGGLKPKRVFNICKLEGEDDVG